MNIKMTYTVRTFELTKEDHDMWARLMTVTSSLLFHTAVCLLESGAIVL